MDPKEGKASEKVTARAKAGSTAKEAKGKAQDKAPQAEHVAAVGRQPENVGGAGGSDAPRKPAVASQDGTIVDPEKPVEELVADPGAIRESSGTAGIVQEPPAIPDPNPTADGKDADEARQAELVGVDLGADDRTVIDDRFERTVIKITSKVDGFWRGGVSHPTRTETYPVSFFSPRQLDQILIEPLLVTEILEPKE